MKHNFKRLLVLVCMFACLFAMTACGEEEKKTISLTQEQKDALIKENEDALLIVRTYTEDQIQAKIDDGSLPEEYAAVMKNYFTVSGDLGLFQEVKSTTVDTTEDSVIVKSETVYSERTMTFTMSYDAKGNLTMGKFEPYYSFGEKMAKAGMNTLIGMGTVFIVLIGMSFIISLFKFIGTAGTKKTENKTDAAAAVDNTIAQIVEKEEAAMDDLELVAVIMAAIAASEGTSSDGLVVRSIRKVNKSKWINA